MAFILSSYRLTIIITYSDFQEQSDDEALLLCFMCTVSNVSVSLLKYNNFFYKCYLCCIYTAFLFLDLI